MDPVEALWIGVAGQLGLQVRRHGSAYASTDGKGTLTIGPPEALDEDDSVAQIVLHEACHALVQGEESFGLPDWGLPCDEDSEAYQQGIILEHACLRVQAALLRRHGLRWVLAPTTEFRSFYDELPDDPMEGNKGDPGIELARRGLSRAVRAPVSKVLDGALRATAAVHEVVQGVDIEKGERGKLPLLWSVPSPGRHVGGAALHEDPAKTCGTCVWKGRWRCLQTGARVEGRERACVLHEGALDCQECAACCRHAYELVPLRKHERAARRHPELIVEDGARLHLKRGKDRCLALAGPEGGPYGCTIYPDRPRTCRDFERGGENCLDARQRVGLSL
jgi:hypothetical protein